MQKQHHRAVERTADNRYWQNQFRVDDAELEPPADFAEYTPPTLSPSDTPRRSSKSEPNKGKPKSKR